MTGASLDAWFIGCGNMAGAMIEGWRRAGVDLSGSMAVRPSGMPVEGLRVSTRLDDGPAPELVFLGFKPQILDQVTSEIGGRIGSGTVVISILAGVETASLRQRFPRAKAIIRAMPNLPVSEGRGVVALFSEDADVELRATVGDVFGLLGRAHWSRDQVEFSVIGAVAGAGPAYVARFISALAKAGEARGLALGLAQAIALETIAGTALMAEARGEAMDEVARRVASPRGTTEAGLAVLDEDKALDRLIERTIAAAAGRGAVLAEAARAIDSPPSLP